MAKKTPNTFEAVKTFREFLPWFRQHEKRLRERLDDMEASFARVFGELGRALLLSGNGERFTPAIEAAIHNYAIVCEELERCDGSEDAAMGFLRIRSEAEYGLALLGVAREEVVPGTAVDKERHHVRSQLSTSDASKLHTVTKCLLPYFSWTDGNGKVAWRPAQVEAYTKLCEEPSVVIEPNEPSNGSAMCEMPEVYGD